MKENNNDNRGRAGVAFADLLALVFIVLKLIGVIDWSWVWVLSPLWISILMALIILLVLYLIFKFGR